MVTPVEITPAQGTDGVTASVVVIVSVIGAMTVAEIRVLLLPRESVVVMFSTIGEITVAEMRVLLLPRESVVVMFSKIVGMVSGGGAAVGLMVRVAVAEMPS